MDKVNSADLSSSVLLNVVAHRLSGPPHVLKDKSIYVYSEGQKMFEIERASAERRSVKDRRRFFALVGYVTKVRNKEFNKIGDHSRKDEMGMSKLANGRA